MNCSWSSEGPCFLSGNTLMLLPSAFCKGNIHTKPPQHKRAGTPIMHAVCTWQSNRSLLWNREWQADWHVLAQKSLSCICANSAMPIQNRLPVCARAHSILTHSLSQHHKTSMNTFQCIPCKRDMALLGEK